MYLSFGDWKEGGSWGDLLSARKLEGRGSSGDRVDVGCFGEQGVGGFPKDWHKERQGKPGLQRVLKLKGANAFVLT